MIRRDFENIYRYTKTQIIRVKVIYHYFISRLSFFFFFDIYMRPMIITRPSTTARTLIVHFTEDKTSKQ